MLGYNIETNFCVGCGVATDGGAFICERCGDEADEQVLDRLAAEQDFAESCDDFDSEDEGGGFAYFAEDEDFDAGDDPYGSAYEMADFDDGEFW